MTPEQLAEIRARAEAATPGPWECGDDGWPLWWPEEGRGSLPWWASGLSDNYNDPYHPYEISFPTIDFVAHARTDIPTLLDYIEELQEALRGIEDCVAHPDRVKGEIAGTICVKCLTQVSTLITKEPTNA